MNIIPNYLRINSQLQNLIDQAPHAHTADQARELMRKIPRIEPGFQHDDYATVPQVEIGKEEVAK